MPTGGTIGDAIGGIDGAEIGGIDGGSGGGISSGESQTGTCTHRLPVQFHVHWQAAKAEAENETSPMAAAANRRFIPLPPVATM